MDPQDADVPQTTPPRHMRCSACKAQVYVTPDARFCPACGSATSSAMIERFSEIDRAWLETLRSGTVRTLWSMGLTAVLLTPAWLAYYAAHGGNSRDSERVLGGIGILVLSVPVMLVGLTGLWRLTETPGEHVQLLEDAKEHRQRARKMTLAVFWLSIASTLAFMLSGDSCATGLIDLVSAVLSLVAILAFCRVLAGLADWMSNTPLAKRTRHVMWGCVISFGVLAVTGLSASLGARNDLAELLALPACVALVATVIYFVWSFVLILQYRARFDDLIEMRKRFLPKPRLNPPLS
ncbi:MAG: zinc ribbon domain-containing protein [Planctomycetota bacterium]